MSATFFTPEGVTLTFSQLFSRLKA